MRGDVRNQRTTTRRVGKSPTRRVGKSPTRRVGKSPTLWLGESGSRQFSDSESQGLPDSLTQQVRESAFECLKENSPLPPNRQVGESASRGIANYPAQRVEELSTLWLGDLGSRRLTPRSAEMRICYGESGSRHWKFFKFIVDLQNFKQPNKPFKGPI